MGGKHMKKDKIDGLLDELLDSYDVHKHLRHDKGFLDVKKNIAHAIRYVATSAQRAGGAATKGVTSELKAKQSAVNGRKGGRPAGNLYLAVSVLTNQSEEFTTLAKAQHWAATTPGAHKVNFYRLPYKEGDERIGYHNSDRLGNQEYRIFDR